MGKIKWFVLLSLLLCATELSAKKRSLDAGERNRISEVLSRMVDREVAGGGARISRVAVSGRTLRLYASIGLANYPFRERNVRAMYDSVRAQLPAGLRKYKIELYTDGHLIEDLIPLACRTRIDRRRTVPFTNRASSPLVRRASAPNRPSEGLQDRHIALWQSHGRYFDQTENRWRWQRTAAWQTREDLFTLSFVLPYLVPMLENAGANVLLPRERDLQRREIIVDGDGSPYADGVYRERDGMQAWYDAGVGFAHRRRVYRSGENPFEEGRSRAVPTVDSGERSTAEWRADIPERDRYAVYVSYRSFEASADDASYTVFHAGGESRFSVNQTIGGGTWVYLGTFDLPAGRDRLVVRLDNRSARAGRVVSADAVKIGGGYGNICRTVCDSLRREGMHYFEQVSSYPRFCEGARYWLQWAGFPREVYSPCGDGDDYKDDYMARALWVNRLAGGSERLPDQEGLGIPVDLALAFHTDSGIRETDETIGTLGIFYTAENKGRFEGGASRYLSRDLTDVVMTQIVGDIRLTYEPLWRRRGLWNRSYFEARVPAVPTMLLELLSHQNFADMRYGHDPRFKFLVARAVYKGILKHVAAQYGYRAVVQPLPVEGFSVCFAPDAEDEVVLSWHPQSDPLEPTAVPESYILYTRTGDGGFDEGRRVDATSVRVKQEPGVVYSYRVSACNAGGESFAGETLAACRVPQEKGRVLVVNGFDRVSGPLSFRHDSLAGFCPDYDNGVPYLMEAAYIGAQQVFECSALRDENPFAALGACSDDRETELIGGNTFDYPALHGASIAAAGYSFCSAGVAAVERGDVLLTDYLLADLILGKQRAVTIGRGTAGYEFALFSPELQRAIRRFTARGGAIFISGSYVASDLWEGEASSDVDRAFAREVLGYELGSGQAARKGMVRVWSPEFTPGEYRFCQELRPDLYAVESPDALRPASEAAYALMRYAENGRIAAVALDADYKTVVMGFPFESIPSQEERDRLMGDILRFFEPMK